MAKVNVVVAVFKGCADAVRVCSGLEFIDQTRQVEKQLRDKYGIPDGQDAESENQVQVFYNVEVE
ncbi:MAG: hypothetical protein PHI12_06550 [Dehalococcoidales bacterium]|nr:hypothetical protein [Dehalococcoidales bacterium]